MDHFNIDLGGGNLFEWAKDMEKMGDAGGSQDKDIVFALNPEPFESAGVDLENVDGWAYAQVPVHVDGVPAEVWKLLKPFDLR
jgi:F420-0:gamma-glutamyl ligase-like protein